MKSNLKDFTNDQLLDEIKSRMLVPPVTATPPIKITPYEIMLTMIEQGWSENPAKGKSDPRIDKMWHYLGYPAFTDDESYCAATVNACLKLAGYETSESIPSARSFTSYGKYIIQPSQVDEGDIAVFERTDSSWKGHVGFVKDINFGLISVSGGNQDNKMSTKLYKFNQDNLSLKCFRRITDMNKVSEPDYKTLKEWGLI